MYTITRTLFSISVASLAVLKITDAKYCNQGQVIITELTAATVIQPFLFQTFNDSNK